MRKGFMYIDETVKLDFDMPEELKGYCLGMDKAFEENDTDTWDYYHEVIGEFGAGRVLIKPAKEGTGVIAGGAARAVLELAGVKDIRTKCLRSNNKKNVVRATIAGLAELKQADEVAKLRGKTVDEIKG